MICPYCNDRGGFRGPRGWQRCQCQKPTREQLQAQRDLYAPRDQLPFSEGIRRAREAIADAERRHP